VEGLLAPWHWAILIVALLLIFGPKKLPELGSSLGKGIQGFRRGMKDVQEDVSNSMSMSEPANAETNTGAEAVSAVTAQAVPPARTPVVAEGTVVGAAQPPAGVCSNKMGCGKGPAHSPLFHLRLLG
jgi:sec-independent protein translocase protein TatA